MSSPDEDEQDQTLIRHLVTCLSAITSPDPTIRQNGEKELKLLEVTEDFGVHLTKITVDHSCDIALRQLSSLILKQYVETHWCSISEKFCPPEANDFAKSAIRQMLPLGLQDPYRKVRSSVAYAISAIACWDWPENWPELFSCLMQALKSGDPNCVHGSMCVLIEFVRDLTDSHVMKVLPDLLTEMFHIFTQAEVYNVRVRTNAVKIFITCSSLVHAIADNATIKTVFFSYLTAYVQTFVEALKVPNGEASDSGLKKEVVRAINILLKSFPKELKFSMTTILPVVWSTLTNGADFYVKTEVNSVDDVDKEVDSDGEVIGLESLIFGMFDLIDTMLDIGQYRVMIKGSLEDLIYYLILCMQISQEQMKSWLDNPDQFVEDEDDETFSYSIRISAQDLLLTCCREFKKASSVALFKAIEKHITQGNLAQQHKQPFWWKTYEASMLAIGSVQSLVVESIRKKETKFDVNFFLTSVVLPSMKVCDAPFLVGRALWIASRFAELIEPVMLKQLLEATVQGLQEQQSPPVRICAVRAVFHYCEYLKQVESTQILSPYLVPLFDGLLHLAIHAMIETLALVLETLRVVLNIDETATAQYESQVSPFTLAVFLKYSNDPLIVSLCTDIFQVLSSQKHCYKAVLDRLIPTFASIFTGPPEKIGTNIVAISLDLLCAVVRNGEPPLPETLITTVFPAVITTIVESDDNAIIQNGGDCVRAFLSVASKQISSWKDESGTSGLYYVLRVVSHLLDPKLSEYTASFVGRLVSVLIREFGEGLGDVLDQLLRAVLSKLQQAETLSVAQSLVVIFANLFNHEFLPTLEFLCNVPGPSGNTALDFVMTLWCEKQNLFYGSYETKVCIMALSKLFQHAVTANDNRLNSITVKGDQIFQESSGIRTRSKVKEQPEKWTTISLPVKLLKLLITELGNTDEVLESGSIEDENDEAWEEEDDDEAEEHGAGDADRQTLSELLDDFGDGFSQEDYNDTEEDDPDALADPINNLNMREHLTNFLVEFCNSCSYLQHFSTHLNNNERNVLKGIGIVV